MTKQMNIRNLSDDAYARLQTAAEAEGITVAEYARRALTLATGTSHTAAEADSVMIRGGIPKWTRDKVLAIITGATPGVPQIR
jgi:plasmid stability protein